MIGIVHGNRHIGITHGLPGLRSGKDDVLHGPSAQGFGALFAKNPADRVRYIALSGPVRAHDAGNSVVKLEHNLVRKGFEALYFKTFQIHISNSGHHVIVIPLFLSESRARYAASCSAAFFVLPLPTPSVFSPIRSATVKCLS